ncbi:MAG: VWA domain-containing protein [Candidatus Riesia sp.]|nr:VWA domain-containing protein [Candidatus Riesia sp.]
MKSLRNRRNREILENFGKEKNVIRADFFDVRAYKRSVGKALFRLQEEGKKNYEQFPELLQDAFSSLYKFEPESVSEFELQSDYLLNKILIDEIVETPKYKELRVDTVSDEVISTIATEILGTELKDNIQKLKERLQEQLDAIAQAVQDLKDVADEDENGDLENVDGSGLTLEQAKEKLEEYKKDLKDELHKDKEFAPLLRRSLDLAQTKVHEAQTIMQAWGLNSSETFSESGYREKLDLLNKIKDNQKLKKIAELAGRMIPIALSTQREKVKDGVRELSTIEYSKNLDKVLSSELINLTDEYLEYNFYSKLIEGKLQTHKFRGKEKKKRGSIVMALDSSGSMGGEPEIWSKAIGMAILEVARAQKRDFAGIHFSGDHRPERLKVHTFLKSESHDIKKLLDFCTYFENGGTNFEAPLQRAINICESNDEQWEKSTIIFVTDGQAPVSNAFLQKLLEWKKLRKINIISVQIDAGWNFAESLKEFSDEVHKLSDIQRQGDAIALSLFENLV